MANGNGPSPFAIRHSLFAFSGQIPHFGPVFGLLCLDSGLSAAISPGIRRGISRAACFCANFGVRTLTRAKIVPITTDQKADPDTTLYPRIGPRPGSNTKELNDVRSHQNRRPAIPRRPG